MLCLCALSPGIVKGCLFIYLIAIVEVLTKTHKLRGSSLLVLLLSWATSSMVTVILA
jgi:hypothetical protein